MLGPEIDLLADIRQVVGIFRADGDAATRALGSRQKCGLAFVPACHVLIGLRYRQHLRLRV